jgi:uncharacterized protein
VFNFLKSNDSDYYQWFNDAANTSLKAALTLQDLCYNFTDVHTKVQSLHDLEHEGDNIGHRIYEQLNKSYVTPLDREDIIALYSSIDDMIDFIHSAGDMMIVYTVDMIPPVAKQLADCVVGCAQEVAKSVPHIRKRSELSMLQSSIIQINSLENQADDLLREGLVELFSHPQDVVHIIKWRDIYEEMEGATDRAEDIADVLRGLAIKHA